MRRHPRILSMHMSMAANYWQERFESGAQDAAEIQDQFTNMMRGIQMYMAHDFCRDDMTLYTSYNDGALSLLRCHEGDNISASQPVMLLIPSLINKAHIFDLNHTRSMLRYFEGQGITAYLLDWGEITADAQMQTIDDIIEQKMHAALSFINAQHDAPIHALGYCMGGTVLAGYAAMYPHHFASLIYMAAPWDFHAGSQNLLNRVKFWTPSLLDAIKSGEAISDDWLQMLFSSLFPAQAMQKFARFATLDQDSDEAHIFVAIEDWLNDGVPLPAPIAQQCLMEWFLGNTTACANWQVSGQVIDVSSIKKPSLIVASSKDQLVEYDCAFPLLDALNGEVKCAQHLDPQCGHVGMIAGKNAMKNLWEPLRDWVHNQSG